MFVARMRPFDRSLLLLVILALGVFFSNAARRGVRRKLSNIFASPAKVAVHNYWYSQQKHVSKKHSAHVKGGYIIKVKATNQYENRVPNAFDKTQPRIIKKVVQLDGTRNDPWWKAQPQIPVKGKGVVSKGVEYPDAEGYWWWQDDSNGKGKGGVTTQRPSGRPTRTRAPYGPGGLFPTNPPRASTLAPTQTGSLPSATEPTAAPTPQQSVTSSTSIPTPALSDTLDPTPDSSPPSFISNSEVPTPATSVFLTVAPTSSSTERSQQPSTSTDSSAQPTSSPISLPASGEPSFQPISINTDTPEGGTTIPPVIASAIPSSTEVTAPSDIPAQTEPTFTANTEPPVSTADPEESIAPTPGGSSQPSSSNTDTTVSTVDPESSVAPTPEGSPQPTTGQAATNDPEASAPPTPSDSLPPALSTTLTPGGTQLPTTALNSEQPAQFPTTDPDLASAIPTPLGSLLTATPTPPGSLQSGPPVARIETSSPITPSTQQPTSLTLVIETVPKVSNPASMTQAPPNQPSTSPPLLETPSASSSPSAITSKGGSPEIGTDGAIGMNVESTPFVVDYILSFRRGQPSTEDIRVAQSITYSYLSEYLFSQMFQNPTVSFIGESVTAVRTTTTASAVRIEYEFVATFSEGSKSVPSTADLDRKILLAFSQPAVQTLLIDLQDLPEDNSFSETSDVSFVIGNVPPLAQTESEPPTPAETTENEFLPLSTLGLAMLGMFLGVVGLGLILMRRRRRRLKDVSVPSSTRMVRKSRQDHDANKDTPVRQCSSRTVAGFGDHDIGALIHPHAVPPSVSTAPSIPMSTNSAIIQEQLKIIEESAAGFLLSSKSSNASAFNSIEESSFPPTRREETRG
jgi:hypothetical protein